MKSNVLNSSIGAGEVFDYPRLTPEQEADILAGLFEQLLIFDKITLTANRLNFTLIFLIHKLGINTVERLIESGYLDFILWSPVIVSGGGRRMEDGSIDESVIYGQPPLASGTLSPEDLDPEKNIKTALSHFALHPDRKRIFIKKARRRYFVPDGMLLATDAAKLVISAYQNNNLESLGLPYNKEPEQLNLEERGKLLDLGNTVTETAILAQYGLKSYENYEPYAICKKNLENIGKAYNISANTANLFKIENVPNLKQLFLSERLDFDSVFTLRHLSNAKYYRKWINQVGENSNAQEVSEEYLNEIKGNGKFFEKTGGKLLKNLTLFGGSTAISTALGPIGIGAEFVLGLLEEFWLDNILKGKNPSMFIDDIKKEIAPDAKLKDPPINQSKYREA